MEVSLLFWPVKLKGKTIYVLDETALPQRPRYIRIKNHLEAVKVIKEMRTRAIGQVLLVFYLFLLIYRENKSKPYSKLSLIFKEVAKSINQARPTLSFKYLTDLILGWFLSGQDLQKNILNFLERLRQARLQQAEEVASLFKARDVVLTHCNISGLLSLAAGFCLKANRRIEFFVTETRPYLQGSRLTAWELKQQGFTATVISDNTVAYVMQKGMVNKVVVGADYLAQNGDIANKIGTYQIALLAKHFDLPFYVVCPPPGSAKTGQDIPIEIRPERELLEYKGLRIAPQGVRGFYPAFDITPHQLITKHIYLKI